MTNHEGALVNDEARMTNDEGMLINDEARMTNDEGMTKSEAQKPGSADDFLRIIARAVPELKLQARELWREPR